MKTQYLACCLAFMVTFPASASFAHEQHKGSPLSGSIASVSGDNMTIEAEGRVLAVTLAAKTKIVAGHGEADRNALEPGGHVVVYGNKLRGGGGVAQEIVVHETRSERSGDRGSP
jgi:hypothetical protein